MAAIRLDARACEKPWGRRDLSPWSTLQPAAPVGEMIYDSPGASAALLVKALFTAERLSIQVHPDAAAARALGLPCGKDEAWVVLAADPGATIGLGLKAPASRATLAAAARDGSIVDLVDWRPCVAGDVLFAPAGTIHAIGGGLVVLEVQQNLDLTYRLYDYGRPRELHLVDGLAAADPSPWRASAPPRPLGGGRTVLVDADAFVLERLTLDGSARLSPVAGRPVWLALLGGAGTIDGAAWMAGEVWLADAAVEIEGEGGDLLLAYPGQGVAMDIWQTDRAVAA